MTNDFLKKSKIKGTRQTVLPKAREQRCGIPPA